LETSLSLRRIDEKDLVLYSVAFPAGAPRSRPGKNKKKKIKKKAASKTQAKSSRKFSMRPTAFPRTFSINRLRRDSASVLKFAIGFGGSLWPRCDDLPRRQQLQWSWGPPTMMALEGGSAGLQTRRQRTDFVLLLMSPRSASSMLSSKVKLGGDVSAAAGPVGRAASAETDVALRSEILSYSRSRGLFAGISLEGSTLRAITAATINSTARRSVPATSSSNMRSQFHPAQKPCWTLCKKPPQKQKRQVIFLPHSKTRMAGPMTGIFFLRCGTATPACP